MPYNRDEGSLKHANVGSCECLSFTTLGFDSPLRHRPACVSTKWDQADSPCAFLRGSRTLGSTSCSTYIDSSRTDRFLLSLTTANAGCWGLVARLIPKVHDHHIQQQLFLIRSQLALRIGQNGFLLPFLSNWTSPRFPHPSECLLNPPKDPNCGRRATHVERPKSNATSECRYAAAALHPALPATMAFQIKVADGETARSWEAIVMQQNLPATLMLPSPRPWIQDRRLFPSLPFPMIAFPTLQALPSHNHSHSVIQ